MPADVIERLHKMSRRSPDIPALEFANRAGVPIDDDDDDDDDDSDFDDDADAWDDDDNSNFDPTIANADDQVAGVNLYQDIEPEEFDEFEQNEALENVEKILDPPNLEQEIHNI